jgi:hypothetical protein
MAAGRDDVTADPMERGSRRSSSIPEVTKMNAPAPTVGTTPRPAAEYRLLVMRGLAPDEAANITAVVRGLPILQTPWTVRQISHLLFLRAMREVGRFGPDDSVD